MDGNVQVSARLTVGRRACSSTDAYCRQASSGTIGQVEPYLAELSRTIDAKELGRRLRNARLAAGLTQAEVTAGEVAASYLSRIEDGQRRPEAVLLERMVQRMGTTLEAILVDEPSGVLRQVPTHDAELELGVDHAELAAVSGDAAGALARLDELAVRLAQSGDAVLERRALRVRAGALEGTGDLNGAITLLEDLTAEPSPDATWLKSLIALSRCYRNSGEFSKAIAVGTRTAALIEEMGLAGLTEAMQLTITVSGAYYRLGDVNEALRMCARALAAAEKYDSPIAKASAYWNASSYRAQTEGATPETIEMAKKALALFELGDDNRNLAKLRTEVANLLLTSSPPDPSGALDVLASAELELAWSGASAWERSLFHLLRGEAHALLGEFVAVAEDVDRARSLMPDAAPVLSAQALVLEGRVAVADGRVEDARVLFRRGAASLTGAGADRDAATLWFDLANLLSEVGETEAALDAFRSAGASGGFRVKSPNALPVRQS